MSTLEICTRIDTDLTFRLPPAIADSVAWMTARRRWVAAIVLLASVLDLVLTQTILTALGAQAGVGGEPAEANPLMAGVVMTWWAWPLRVGIPAIAVVRDLRAKNYGLITVAATLYGGVVVWNTYMLHTVTGALS